MRKKNRHKIIIGIEVMILSITVSLLGPNAASANPPSNGVSYNKNGQVTVENALDNLYSKANYGNAASNDILKGKKALVGGKEVVGTFTCPPMSSDQTAGDAKASDIAFGKIAWVNGEKVLGIKGSLANILDLGDYISYTPSSTSYTISSSDTGHSSDVTINPSELNVWMVIQKNDDGTVDVVSQKVSSNIVYFYDPHDDEHSVKENIGYLNYIGTLNKIAKAYETDGYTVGSRHIGYDGTAIEYCSDYSSCSSDDGYETDMELVGNAMYIKKKKSQCVVYSEGSPSSYCCGLAYGGFWLASRDIPSRSSSGYENEVRVASSCNISESTGIPYMFSSKGASIRPIVVLKANLRITGGYGTEYSPYTLET